MKFNNGLEKKKFEIRWESMRKEYAEAGMSVYAINKMYEYDCKMYLNERKFCDHNQYMSSVNSENEGGEDAIAIRYEERFINEDVHWEQWSRYGWIENIDNVELYRYLKTLPEERLDLITMYVFEEKTQEEIAKILGISRSSVADRIARIKNNLKKYV